MDGVVRVLQSLPHIARRSITFDRGTEFTEWAYLQAGIGAATWFCDPQSPWQISLELMHFSHKNYLWPQGCKQG